MFLADVVGWPITLGGGLLFVALAVAAIAFAALVVLIVKRRALRRSEESKMEGREQKHSSEENYGDGDAEYEESGEDLP